MHLAGTSAGLRILPPGYRQRVPVRVAGGGGVQFDGFARRGMQVDNAVARIAAERGDRMMIGLLVGLDAPVHSTLEVVVHGRSPSPDRDIITAEGLAGRRIRPDIADLPIGVERRNLFFIHADVTVS